MIFSFFSEFPRTRISCPGCVPNTLRSFLEAHRMIPSRFRENSKFHENLDFSESCPDTSIKRKFAQTIESTQRMHRWIAYDLRKDGKLIRSETNSQTLRNLDFCDQNLHFFDTHVDARFPVLCYYS